MRLRRSPGGEHGNPLQYSCLENSTDRGAWQATVHGIAKNWMWLSAHMHTHTHTHTPGITLLWFQFCLLNISCYWSWYWSSGLFLTTDGILIERFNDINTPTSGGSLSHDAEQLFQYSATPAWNSNFLLNYQAPLSCFLLYVSVTLSHISLEHLSECFEINNSHPGSLLAHKTPSYELEKGTPSLEKSEKDRIMPTMYFYKVPGTN